MPQLPETVALCSNRDEQHDAFRVADAQNRPHLFIRPARKYAYVECDMISTDAILTTDAMDRIHNIQERYANQAYADPSHKKSPVERSWSQTLVSMTNLTLPAAKEFATKIEPIVTDPANHCPRDGQ